MCTVPHQNHWLQAHVGSIVHSFCRCRGWSSFTGIYAAQESANPPAEKEACFMHDNLISQRWVPTCCPCTVSPSAGYRLCGTWQKDDPIGGGHDTNTSRSVNLDSCFVRTPMHFSTVTIFHASFTLFKQAAALLGESLGNVVEYGWLLIYANFEILISSQCYLF